MFLIRLPPGEVVGTKNHKTAVAMVRAADALWDARGGYDHTAAAATTQFSRSPAPTSGKKNAKRNGNPPKVALLPALTSFLYKTQAMAFANFRTSMATKHRSAFSCVPGRKTKAPPNPYLFGSKFSTCHCHSHVFPSKCRLHFSNGQVD
jgi:hypothetical protein